MTQNRTSPYRTQHHVRIVTAASLFDGHDAAINIMRRILQASGAEVIHLGHNRSVAEIVECAIQEDAQGIAITSYQGGHVEYLKYMFDLLKDRGADTKIFAGGGGTILPSEIEELHAHGVARVYSPDDGREMGLQGMINDVLEQCDFEPSRPPLDEALSRLKERDPQTLAKLITLVENHPDQAAELAADLEDRIPSPPPPVLGITGTGGSGKSSLVDELVRRFLTDFDRESIAVISVDPSKRKTGGALLGDRIRMNSIHHERVFMRSLATRQSNLALSPFVKATVQICKAAGFDLIIVETSGIGQSDTEITEHSDVSLYVMTAEYGAATQLEKIDMLDFADVVAINKFEKAGSLDALRDVKKQVRRNTQRFDASDDDILVYGTIASQFNDPGTHVLYRKLMDVVSERCEPGWTSTFEAPAATKSADEGAPQDGGSGFAQPTVKPAIIPADRVRYLAEIADTIDQYGDWVTQQSTIARQMFQLHGTIQQLEPSDVRRPGQEEPPEPPAYLDDLRDRYDTVARRLDAHCKGLLDAWPAMRERYAADVYSFQIRGRTIEQPLRHDTLSGNTIARVVLPAFEDWGEILRWQLTENVPGHFPFAAGVFPLKRKGEDPTRMFAGEGGPERTNKRFHYLSQGMPAARLSTAFDSVTLYGEDPDHRPDIYGKVGNSGVSIATVDDAKKLYSGFDLAAPTTSVSMTINGPAPMLLAFFMNAAIDQQCERYLREQGRLEAARQKRQAKYDALGLPLPEYQGELPEGNEGLGLALLGVSGDEVLERETYERIKADTLTRVRGTVQADILKEDQAQNTCIFSTEFGLRMMGDIQEYFTEHGVRNFYSVSISGYHIAEAGANPISQLAFTLANGFTFVEYYLARGLHVDDFAPNLSFFFSNGLDPEYTVIGRVARRIWAKAMKLRYRAGERSQKLKYHIQTSGRSLHAQEIAFNDIRTTLQALTAIYDNCNSLHTNAYDEAITTPTEESVRRAVAIQLIISKELGLAKNENPLQGSFIIEELTDLVEAAVLAEFRRISERGGVLGAMERMYQRTKIQEESLLYESKKHSGELPIVGVNTYLDPKGSLTVIPQEVIRSRTEEKEYAIASRDAFHRRNDAERNQALARLQRVAVEQGNIFEELLETTKRCSLGQISGALYDVGGKYRRNM